MAVPVGRASWHAEPLHRELSHGPSGLARLTPVRQGPAAIELPDDEYPIVLNTGRVLYHWHGGTMTTRVDGLVDMVPEVQATINPIDADTYGVASRRVRFA